MSVTRWGLIGPGAIARNFADGLAEAPSGALVAVASRSEARARAFGDRYRLDGAKRYTDYRDLCADPDVDAVHISTPHVFHAEQALMAIRAGKHVSVEKPAGVTAAEVRTIVEAAARERVFLMEAYMYLCHPQIARALEILRSGEIGKLRLVRATFGFEAPFDPESRLFSPELGGGAILDVGGYPVSAACLFAGAAERRFAQPEVVSGTGAIGRSGVVEIARGALTFADGITAEIGCAISRPMENAVYVEGDKGSLSLPDPWTPGRDGGPADVRIHVIKAEGRRIEELRQPEHLFAFEAEAASRAIAEGRSGLDWPAMAPAASIGTNSVLEQWRTEVA
ncbi:Gfo/Idh/MocA family protein [Roseivivax sediminis]|uniref:Predicted dehydrogenase n=1 Tax=Roseivivax sediminis TaxID=936889 RepID=A0A1I1SZN4_9RHOB|nr:Gfo/Idh/MocA family oxidoreductase [Roseivivax sediminis]SFD51909.1 Predicted dehydrogenase [Roseivivax sediminis]